VNGTLILVFVVYYRIFHTVARLSQTARDEAVRGYERTVAWKMFILVAAFAANWGPYGILLFYEGATNRPVSPTADEIILLGPYFSTVVNPVLYAYMNMEVRKSIWEAFGKKMETIEEALTVDVSHEFEGAGAGTPKAVAGVAVARVKLASGGGGGGGGGGGAEEQDGRGVQRIVIHLTREDSAVADPQMLPAATTVLTTQNSASVASVNSHGD